MVGMDQSVPTEELERRIYEFGAAFVARMPEGLAAQALEYVRAGEWPLAVEMLCDHDVPIRRQEFDELMFLGRACNADMSGRGDYIRQFIID